MRKIQKILIIAASIFFLIIITIITPQFTGRVILNEKILLGYCPTMSEEAKTLAEKGNYELIQFGSASEVLFALNKGDVDKGLIGRKAESYEINEDTQEIILKSGYTMISNNKRFIDYSQLSDLEIYTYLSEEEVKKLISDNSDIFYYETKEESIKKINEGEIVLISWEDWNDNYELVVVVDGNEKAKDFRGVFLYES